MRALPFALVVASFACFADTGWKNAGSTIGPVRDINCAADGGLLCTRAAASTRGDLTCNSATAVEPGCVVPGSQTWAGNKTFTGNVKAVQLDAGAAYIAQCSIEGQVASCPIVDGGLGIFGQLQAASASVSGTITDTVNSAAAFKATGSGYYQATGVASGSLPTCNAGAKGALQFDSTLGYYRSCDGTLNNWWVLDSQKIITAYYGGSVTTANTPVLTWSSVNGLQNGTVSAIGMNITRAGDDGAHSFTVRLRDTTGSSTVCSSSSVLCNHAVGLGTSDACSTATALHTLELQVDVSACTGTIPLFNAFLNTR